MLDARFNDMKIVIHALVDKLLNLETPTRENPKLFTKALDALKSFAFNLTYRVRQTCETCDILIADLVIRRLSEESMPRLRDQVKNDDRSKPYTVQDIVKFLEDESKVWAQSTSELSTKNYAKFQKPKSTISCATTSDESSSRAHSTCLICNKPDHSSLFCPELKECENKIEFLRMHKLCIFCAKHKFSPRRQCKVRKYLKCDHCNDQHMSALCSKKDSNSGSSKPKSSTETPKGDNNAETSSLSHCTISSGDEITSTKTSVISNSIPENHDESVSNFETISHATLNETDESCSDVMLPTAFLKISSPNAAVKLSARAMVDMCSQACYISENVSQKLRLKKKRTSVYTRGTNGKITGKIESVVHLRIHFDNESIKLKCLVVPKVTSTLPQNPPPLQKEEMQKYKFADPQFYKPGVVDLMIGALIIPNFIGGTNKTVNGMLFMESRAGILVCGRPSNDPKSRIEKTTLCHLTAVEEIENLWKDEDEILMLEDLEKRLNIMWDASLDDDSLSEEEKEKCEREFVEKHFRDSNGRFHVPMLWKDETKSQKCGNSYDIAVAKFLSQEKRMQKDDVMKKMNQDFMTEYIARGDMTQIPKENHKVRSGDVFLHFYVVRCSFQCRYYKISLRV